MGLELPTEGQYFIRRGPVKLDRSFINIIKVSLATKYFWEELIDTFNKEIANHLKIKKNLIILNIESSTAYSFYDSLVFNNF